MLETKKTFTLKARKFQFLNYEKLTAKRIGCSD